MKAKRKQYSPIFRAKVALEALKDKEMLAELSKKFEVHPTGPADAVSIGSGSASGSRIF
jgi:transposase-like protein